MPRSSRNLNSPASHGVRQDIDVSENDNIDISALLGALERLDSVDKPRQHHFWSNQPIPQTSVELASVHKRDIGDLISETNENTSIPLPLPLSCQFSWSRVDISDDKQLVELYSLLSENYVEDHQKQFRFDYSPDFIEWALQSPHYVSEYHLGIRDVEAGNALVGFISATPVSAFVSGSSKPMPICLDSLKKTVLVNFLCLSKTLRKKNIAPILISELTRRVHVYSSIFQAIYTAGIKLPTPVSTCRYFHRPLNYTKLLKSGFIGSGDNSSSPEIKAILEKKRHFYSFKSRIDVISNLNFSQIFDEGLLPETITCLKPMRNDHVPNVRNLLNTYLSRRFIQGPYFDSDEMVAHWFLPRKDVIYSFVLPSKNGDEGAVSEFVSFYELNSSVLSGEMQGEKIKAAYLYFYALNATDDRLYGLLKEALIVAKIAGFDVMNSLNIMDSSSELLEQLRFSQGDGSLHYYFYNWKSPSLSPSEICFHLL